MLSMLSIPLHACVIQRSARPSDRKAGHPQSLLARPIAAQLPFDTLQAHSRGISASTSSHGVQQRAAGRQALPWPLWPFTRRPNLHCGPAGGGRQARGLGFPCRPRRRSLLPPLAAQRCRRPATSAGSVWQRHAARCTRRQCTGSAMMSSGLWRRQLSSIWRGCAGCEVRSGFQLQSHAWGSLPDHNMPSCHVQRKCMCTFPRKLWRFRILAPSLTA